MSDFYKYLDSLEDLLEESWNLPVANNKYIINGSKYRTLIQELKDNLPIELKNAKDLLVNKEKILEKAKEEAASITDKAQKNAEQLNNKAKNKSEDIIEKARVQQETLIAEQEIMNIARDRATEIVEQAKNDALKMRNMTIQHTDKIIDDSLKSLEHALNTLHNYRNK